MNKRSECQIPNLRDIAEGNARVDDRSIIHWLKRVMARQWNYGVKKRLKFALATFQKIFPRKENVTKLVNQSNHQQTAPIYKEGDLVRVRSREEIESTLNRWKELKGCAFLEYMWSYCGSTQRVLQVMERFLDERDYQVKKVKGVVLLEGVICRGTPVFGRCDRCCHLFWREEWLEKVENAGNKPLSEQNFEARI